MNPDFTTLHGFFQRLQGILCIVTALLFVFMRYTGIYSPRTGTTTGFKILNNLSGKRDSNPQPSPWQGDILPIELLPHWGEQELNLVHLFLLFNSKMERMMVIETTSPVWQTGALTFVLHPHKNSGAAWTRTKISFFSNKSVYTNIEVTLYLHYPYRRKTTKVFNN